MKRRAPQNPPAAFVPSAAPFLAVAAASILSSMPMAAVPLPKPTAPPVVVLPSGEEKGAGAADDLDPRPISIPKSLGGGTIPQGSDLDIMLKSMAKDPTKVPQPRDHSK